MRIAVWLKRVCILGVLWTGLTAAFAAPGAEVRVMPLGDSITHGHEVPGGYRIRLWQHFRQAGWNVRFVGSRMNGPIELGSRHHEGHRGYTISQLARVVEVQLPRFRPDIVLLHIGTNDCEGDEHVRVILNDLSALIDRITDLRPGALVVVARITPLGPLASPEFADRVRWYNEEIPALVEQKATEKRLVVLADMYDAGVEVALDQVHPTRAGFDTMADVWFAAILAAMP